MHARIGVAEPVSVMVNTFGTHFGRSSFNWGKTDKAQALKDALL